jgi:hypothetical protein
MTNRSGSARQHATDHQFTPPSGFFPAFGWPPEGGAPSATILLGIKNFGQRYNLGHRQFSGLISLVQPAAEQLRLPYTVLLHSSGSRSRYIIISPLRR